MVEKKLFSIGEVSKIKGVTKKALRFYERIGLLKPYYVDPLNRYRYYTVEQFVHIDIIKALRIMEVSPPDIKAVLKNKDTNQLMEFLDSQKEKAIEKIDELKKTIRSIDKVQNTISTSLASISHKDIYTRKIAQRIVVTLGLGSITSTEEAIIEFSKLDRLIEEHRLINTYETGVMFKQVEKSFIPSLIFSAIDIAEDSDSSITSTLPAGDYLCVCFNEENASEQVMKISGYCEESGLEPALVLQVELLNDIFSIGSSHFELQILV